TGAVTFSGSNPISIGNNTVTQANLSGVISGGGSLIVNMNATATSLTLTGINADNYTGSTIVNAGTPALSKGAAVAAVAGPLVIGDGVGGANADVVSVSANNSQITGAVTVNSSGQLNMSTFTASIGALLLDGGNIAGTGAITLST